MKCRKKSKQKTKQNPLYNGAFLSSMRSFSDPLQLYTWKRETLRNEIERIAVYIESEVSEVLLQLNSCILCIYWSSTTYLLRWYGTINDLYGYMLC